MPKDELKEHEFYSKYKMTKAKIKLVECGRSPIQVGEAVNF